MGGGAELCPICHLPAGEVGERSEGDGEGWDGNCPRAAWAGPVPAAGRECCAANNPAAARHLLCHTLHFTFWSYLSGVRSALGIAPWLLVAEGRPTELSQDPEVHGVCVWGGGMHLIHRSPPSPERCSFQSHWSEHTHTQEHCVPPHNLHTHSCTHIFMHTHKHMSACTHTRMCMRPCTCTHMCTCMHACTHPAHACTHVCAQRRTYTCVQLRMHARLHAHVCMHIPVCTRTYTHTHGSTTRPLTPCASPRVPSTPPTPVHAQRPCVQTPPPPLLCTRLLLPITCTRTDTCVQAAACCAHTSAHTPTPAHTHTHV